MTNPDKDNAKMSEAKHTPGKWFYEPCTDTVKRYTDHEKGIYETADCERPDADSRIPEGYGDPV